MSPVNDTRMRQSTQAAPAQIGDAALADRIADLQQALEGHQYLRHAQVVASPGGLPFNVQSYLLAAGLDPTRVKGVYTGGQAYLVASNLEDIEEGIRTALHEVVGHEGVRALLRDRFEPVMRQLYDTFPREHAAWETTAERYGYLDTGSDAGQVAFAEELTAHLAETDSSLGEFDMIKAEIRASMREQIPDLPVTEIEVKALIQRSRESLIMRHGSPEAAAEVRERQTRRTKVAGVVQESMARNGKGVPDALSLALHRDGSKVQDADGIPCRLYHGAGGEVGEIQRGFWGVVDPELANDYAEMRSGQGASGHVVPFYANIQKPFDGDALKKDAREAQEPPRDLTVAYFTDELIRQSGVAGSKAERLQEIGVELARAGLREESGPTYSPHDFWYMPHWMFGLEGAEMLEEAFEIAGFDGVRYTELGHLSYGAFSPAQLHFLDQGASPRGWQPDRHYGEGVATDRPAFRQWFGDSKVVEADGAPQVMYHGTTGDIVAFDERKIRPSDLDADCNGFWFSSSQSASPAMRDASNVMPVYLSIEEPAPYQRVEEVSREVKKDGKLRRGARSVDDEVRYRLQERGYDGFYFTEPTRFTLEQRQLFAETGELTFEDNRGSRVTLKQGSFPETEWQDVASETEVYRYLNAQGAVISHPVANTNVVDIAWRMSLEGLLAPDQKEGLADIYSKVAAFMSSEADSLEVGATTLERGTQQDIFRELVDTGRRIDIVEFYTESLGHVTDYASLEDYERMHDTLVAVAFRPEQIKSAIGNRGSYLRNHPDIRFDVSASARITENAALKSWLGDSRLVEGGGEPLVLYHGTADESFATFNPDRAGTVQRSDWGKGIYLTPHEATADRYRREAVQEQDALSNDLFARYEALVAPVGGVTANLPDAERESAENLMAEFRAARRRAGSSAKGRVMPLYVRMENPLVEVYSHMPNPDLARRAEEQGHDGIIVLAPDGTIDEVVVFEAGQLKSALDNNGQFDRTNTDIRFDMAGNARDTGEVLALADQPAFNHWFRSSQVLDEQGKPQVVYHGSSARFHVFDMHREASRFTTFTEQSVKTQGAFFSPSASDAEVYGDITQPYYLSVQRPFPAPGFMEAGSQAHADALYVLEPLIDVRGESSDSRRTIDVDNGISTLDVDAEGRWLAEYFIEGMIEWSALDNPDLVARMKQRGYDGARVIEEEDDSGFSWFVVDPRQIKSALDNAGTFDPSNPDVRFSFAGPTAKVADRYSLARAQEQAEQGASVEDIRQATGWFQGADNKWRFEIDDSGASLTALFADSSAMDSASWGEISDGASRRFQAVEGRGVRLGDVVDHPRLYAAYPQLASLTVESAETTAFRGNFLEGGGPDESRILLSRSLPMSRVLSVLLHEVQHAIQVTEGFARGGAPDRIGQLGPESAAKARQTKWEIDRLFDAAGDEARRLLASPETAASMTEVVERWVGKLGAYSEDNPFGVTPESAVQFELTQTDSLYLRLVQQYQEQSKLGQMHPQKLYRHLYGEIEARNVQARLELAASERAAVSPEATQDASNTGAIITYNGIDIEAVAAAPAIANQILVAQPSRPYRVPRHLQGKASPDQMGLSLEGLSDLVSGDPYQTLETRPATNDAQKDLGRSALHDLHAHITSRFKRKAGDAVSSGESLTLVGASLTKDIVEGRAADLLGLFISTPEDLAAIAQVYRDPRLETLRFILTKGDQVIGESAITSRMPGVTSSGGNLSERLASIKHEAGADGYWMIHNHPSGSSIPSEADRSTTQDLAKAVEGFRGHVVIDYNEYSVIDRNGACSTIKAPQFEGQDFRADPSEGHPVLGAEVQDPQDLAEIAKRLNIKRDHAVLVGTGGPEGRVMLLTSIPSSYLDYIKDSADPTVEREALAAMRQLLRGAGSGGYSFLVLPESAGSLLPRYEYLLRSGIVEDIVTADGVSAVDEIDDPFFPRSPLDNAARAMQRDDILSPFHQWFSRSCVVDDAGDPLVVFHGSTVDIDVFDTRGDEQSGEVGAFFSTNPGTLDEYTAGEGGNVTPVYLAIRRPYVVSNLQWGMAEGLSPIEARDAGYDGYVIRDMDGGDTYVAFDSDQVRHALDSGWKNNKPAMTRPAPATFQDWFDGSRVADSLGEPLAVYHGTKRDFAEFSDEWVGGSNGSRDFGDGFYFTSLPEAATQYAEDQGGNVMPVYLRIKNPAGMDVLMRDDVQAAVDGDVGSTSLSEVLRGMGYDGVAIDREDGTEYVAFRPEQIRSVTGNLGGFDRNDPDIRFSFAGEGARTADHFSLDNAKRSLFAGLAPEVVRQETGWHRGVDNRWRFEIDDSGARLRPALKTLSRGVRGETAIRAFEYLDHGQGRYTLTLTPELTETTADFIHLVDIDRDALEELVPNSVVKAIDAGEGVDEWGGLLPDAGLSVRQEFIFPGIAALAMDMVLDHPRLFSAYPELRQVMVSVDPSLGAGAQLSEYVDGGEIYVTLGRVNQLGNLIHEIQHAIQNSEGFARGGSPDHYRAAAVMNPQRELEVEAQLLYSEQGDNVSWAEATAEDKRLFTDYAAVSLYRRLAGEVEARNTQVRQSLTASQRQQTPPQATQDTSDENVIVKFGAAEAANMPAPANAVSRPSDGVMRPGSPAFQRWFAGSVVTDEQGEPLTVYRGEHGKPDTGLALKSRHASISFSTASVASHYAENPNNRNDIVSNSRVMPVHLAIERPVMNTPDDPFLEMADVIAAIGERRAGQIAVEMAEYIESTDHWDLTYADQHPGVESLLQHSPGSLSDLYLLAYPVLDRERYVSWFREAGYDGAVHGGSGMSNGQPEFKVFSSEQVRSALDYHSPGAIPEEITLDLAPATEEGPSNFDRWFGDSRVVGSEGRPLVVYKGMYPYDWETETPGRPRGQEITSINRPTPMPAFNEGEEGIEIAGFFGDQKTASHFARGVGQGGATYPVYLSLQKPYEVDAAGGLAGDVQFGESGRAYREAMRSGEYDGAIIFNTSDEGTIYVASRPDQVKSAFNVGSFDPAQADIRLSFAGESARTADRLTLDFAKRSLAAGMSPALVREHCGWEQGADGGWRFEIDDTGAKVAAGEASTTNPDVYLDWIDEAGSRERGVMLSQVLDHPDLYAAYPALAAYRVRVVEPGDLQGSAAFNRDGREILMVDPYSLPMRENGVDPTRSKLLHELQHAIQDIEGFAQGGVPKDMGRILDDKAFSELADTHDRVLRSAEVQGDVARLNALRDQWKGRSHIPQEVTEELQSLREAPSARQLASLQRRAQRMQADKKFGGTTYSDQELLDGYQRLAGEVEARNVQARADMLPNERQQTPAESTEDVPRAEQVSIDADGRIMDSPEVVQGPPLSRVEPDKGAVTNITRTGALLQQVAEDMLDLLDDAGLEYGWMDGGCRMLAEALRDWSEGVVQLGVTSRDGATASHVVGVLALGDSPGSPCAILDADGLASPKELEEKLDKIEMSPGERVVAIGDRADELARTIDLDEGVTCQVVMALEQALGPFDRWQSRLRDELGPQGVGLDHSAADPAKPSVTPEVPATAPER